MDILFGAANQVNYLYHLLCATFMVGGLVAMFFLSENLKKNIFENFMSSLFLLIIGVTLLYYGFSSMIDFYHGNHQTLDAVLKSADKLARIFT